MANTITIHAPIFTKFGEEEFNIGTLKFSVRMSLEKTSGGKVGISVTHDDFLSGLMDAMAYKPKNAEESPVETE